MDSKLKCTFVMPEGSEMNNGSSVGVPSSIGSAPLIKSDSEHLKQGAQPSSPKVGEGWDLELLKHQSVRNQG